MRQPTEQEINEVHDRLLAAGLKQGPADRPRTERAAKALCKELLTETPNATWDVRWFDSLPALFHELGSSCWFWPGRWFRYWASDIEAIRDLKLDKLTDDEERLLDLYIEACEGGGMWVPFEEGVIWAAEPPAVKLDEQGEFHSETGPALLWPNGDALYAWHGVFIPGEWVEQKDSIDPKLVLTHPNAEEARCLGEILGWDRVLKGVKRKVLDRNPDPKVGGELFEVDMQDGPARFVRVVCGTGRTFVLQVADDAANVTEAIAGTYGMPVEVYKRLVVRT
jgi:ribosomal protein L18